MGGSTPSEWILLGREQVITGMLPRVVSGKAKAGEQSSREEME